MVRIKTIVCFTPIFVILALAIQIMINTGVFEQPVAFETRVRNCTYEKQNFPGPEDITQYNKSVLFMTQGDFATLYTLGKPKLEHKNILVIYDADTLHYRVEPLKLVSFPQNISFYPHGMYLRGDLLFVINHAYQNGGERIEVFKVNDKNAELQLDYHYSIKMDQKYNGNLNDLVVYEPGKLLITYYFPLPDPITGRHAMTLLHELYTKFVVFLLIKTTNTIYCEFQAPQQPGTIMPECRDLEQTKTTMANGITWDKKDNVYIADTLEKTVTHYKLVNTTEVLKYQQTIKSNGGLDNIEFNEQQQKIYVSSILKILQHLEMEEEIRKVGKMTRNSSIEYWSGVNEMSVDPNSPDYHLIKPIVISNKIIKGVSTGYVIGNNLWMGSWGDVSPMVCQINM